MLGNKKLTVELTDESRKALVGVSEEVIALQALVGDLALVVQELHERIESEMTIAVEAEGLEVESIRVFADEEAPKEAARTLPAPPKAMQTEQTFNSANEADQIRSSPFTRTPRPVQVAWLLDVLADGTWRSASVLAREYANDERHYRYLRAVMTHRFREMHEEKLIERRDSRAKGSMFEYRIRQGDPHAE